VPAGYRRFIVASVLGLVAVAALAGCGGDGVGPGSIEEQADGTYVFYVDRCADDVTVRVAETDIEVKVDKVRGKQVDGDCVGGVALDLAAPIAERQLIVEDDTWTRIDEDCDLATYSYPDVAERWAWAVPLPCRSQPDG
jgi:hypothetical protein